MRLAHIVSNRHRASEELAKNRPSETRRKNDGSRSITHIV